MARGVEPGAAGFASAAGRLNFRRGSGRSEAWHAESRCIAFARLLLRLNIDRACHLTEAVTAVPAEPAARVERATRRSLSGSFVNNRQIRAHCSQGKPRFLKTSLVWCSAMGRCPDLRSYACMSDRRNSRK